MSAIGYLDDALTVDGTALAPLAERLGTPLYVYTASDIRERYRRLVRAFGARPPHICYALKANPSLGIVALLAREGAGADVVSGGELERALLAGVRPEHVVFAGVGKTRAEIERALEVGIGQFNVEAVEELAAIRAAAAARGVKAPVALRLNPDVAAATHDKISTGRRHDKFGIASETLDAALDVIAGSDQLELAGLHCHIGSQITTIADFERAFERMATFWRHCIGRGFTPKRLNLGGGIGVRYTDEREIDLDAFARMVERITGGLDAEIAFEPGRFLVAGAGLLLSRVVRLKNGGDGRRFVVLDAGMNTLLRPALYGAAHPLLPLVRHRGAASATVDVVGPICESSDVFARDVSLPVLAEGDVVAFANAGAYGAAMASDYNSRGMAGEVLVDGDRVDVLRPPRPPSALWADEAIPDRLRA